MATFRQDSNYAPPGERVKPLVMVFNDTQEILDLFRDIFIEEGYDVVLSSFTPTELDEIAAIKPDLVTLDLLMGEEALGWQLLQKMKMHRATSDIPIVVCTGAAKMARELEGHMAQKNVGLLIKPFDIDDLLKIVRITMDASGVNAEKSTNVVADGAGGNS